MVVPGEGAVSYERGNPVPGEFITRKPSDESTALGHTLSISLSYTHALSLSLSHTHTLPLALSRALSRYRVQGPGLLKSCEFTQERLGFESG